VVARTWQLQEAKNKFSEVVRRARSEGPQVITVRGEEEAVVISMEEYRARHSHEPDRPPPGSLADFLLDPRWADIDIPPRSREVDDKRLEQLMAVLNEERDDEAD
jgi:prevent-host-death family protein